MIKYGCNSRVVVVDSVMGYFLNDNAFECLFAVITESTFAICAWLLLWRDHQTYRMSPIDMDVYVSSLTQHDYCDFISYTCFEVHGFR